jgi:hypothetical protein
VARRAGGLVAVGVIDFIANDLNTLVVIALANGHGETGAIVIFNYCWMVFTALYSVLAVAVTVSAFPVLSAREGAEFDRTCAGSTRAVVLLSWLGTAVIAAISVPAAHVLARNSGQVSQLVAGSRRSRRARWMGLVVMSRVMSRSGGSGRRGGPGGQLAAGHRGSSSGRAGPCALGGGRARLGTTIGRCGGHPAAHQVPADLRLRSPG